MHPLLKPVLCAALLFLAGAAHAQYPERVINLIVAYSSGGGTDLIARAASVKMRHIPFKGSADVRAAIAGKQIVVAAINIGEALQYQKGGTPLRNLAQMSPARTNLAPELATAREQGYAIELSSLRGMVAPKGLPPEIRDRLVRAIERPVSDPEFQAKAVQFFAPLRYLAPAQYEALVREADGTYRVMWKEMPWSDK